MFCDKCGRDAVCGTQINTRMVNIHKTIISVQYRANACGVCGAEIFDEETEEAIMQSASSIYRDKKNMLSPRALKDYMRKHNLTSAQMAEKVGCAVGEIIAASKGTLLNSKTDGKIKKVIQESA